MFRSSRNPLMWAALWKRHDARLRTLAVAEPFLYERGLAARRRTRRIWAGIASFVLSAYLLIYGSLFGATPGPRALSPTAGTWVLAALGFCLPWAVSWYLDRADRRRADTAFSKVFPPSSEGP